MFVVFDNALYYFIFAAYSMWIPQIWKNARQDSCGFLYSYYVVGSSLVKLFCPLYFFTYKDNFIRAQTNLLYSASLLIYVTAQVVVLALQQRYGPRFFLPKLLLAPKYDYFREIPQEVLAQAQTGRLECVICMEHVNTTAERHIEEGEALQSSSQEDGLHYMITPCNHVFHKQCLEEWMEQKLECPICRAPLPAP